MENRCVCCGEIVPEGTQFCFSCGVGKEDNAPQSRKKNFEIYSTPEEAFAAHTAYCKQVGKDCEYECKKCKSKYANPETWCTPCIIAWLYDEVENKEDV